MSKLRNLTDDDVRALASVLETRLKERFYRNIGQGIWAAVWRVIVIAMCVVAAYGVVKGWGPIWPGNK